MHRLLFALTSLGLTAGALAGCSFKQKVFDVVYGEWQYSCGSPKAKGDKCGYDEECAAGLFCDASDKTCSDAWIPDGGACALGASGCDDDGYCRQAPATGTCVAMTCTTNGSCTAGAPTGASCDEADQDCGANATCLLATSPQGTCVPRGEVGDACDTLTGACVDGLMCDVWTTNTCKAPPALGSTCQNNEQCGPSRFCLTASKTLADWEHPGTCQTDPKLPLGAPCTGNVCGAGLHCDYGTNTCARDKAVGEACQNGNECGEDLAIAVDCIRQVCVATTTRGAKCWPGEMDRCTGDLVCVGPK